MHVKKGFLVLYVPSWRSPGEALAKTALCEI